MIGHALALIVCTLVALVQSKALISNNCPRPVYVWSVPGVNGAYPANLRVDPGSRYEEPWRYGTFEHPGIALKVSPESNGINTDKAELNFAYVVSNKTGVHYVWNDLTTIRGNFSDVSFHNCHGSQSTIDVQPSRCSPDNDIELVLCGTKRKSPERDSVPSEKITSCFAHRPGKPDGAKPFFEPTKPATTSTKPAAASTSTSKRTSLSSSLVIKVSVKTRPSATTTTLTERITVVGHTATPDRPKAPTREEPYPVPAASRPSPPPSRSFTPDCFSTISRPAYHPHMDRPVARRLTARDLGYCEPRIVAL